MTQLVGCEFPLFAFSHCRDVVAAVTQAGGFGVLGASGFTPEQLELELAWIDAHVDGKPYGVDVLVPENLAVTPEVTAEEIEARVPAEHREFVRDLLAANGIAFEGESPRAPRRPAIMPDVGEALMDVAFRHPIRLIANALGIAPPSMLERGKAHGVPVAALIGAKEHAVRQVVAGVDVLVAQGGEAGGHCGEVSTLVLVPEVIAAVRPVREVPVLAAGGIMTGRQMAGCMAMGAAGVWTGSVWLATSESETSEIFREKMVAATSRDTIRSKARTGKPSRQLRSTWHDAWEGPKSPGSLPMPMMPVLSGRAFAAIDKAAAAGNPKAREMVSYFVGQGVGLVDSVRSAKSVVQSFKEDFAEATSDLIALAE
jgi:NAD(P)H-dependent flavin oxidoreductase YrpB (nitropropane dioxygenase family)